MTDHTVDLPVTGRTPKPRWLEFQEAAAPVLGLVAFLLLIFSVAVAGLFAVALVD